MFCTNSHIVPNMKKLLVGITLLSQISVSAQTQGFKPLESKGPIPLQITEEVDDLDQSPNPFYETQSYFDSYNKFYNDRFLQGGFLLFGDTITNYLNHITDKLLADDQVLRNTIHVYTSKDYVFNAKTFANGNIVIDMGLLAQLENEAQLAMVIAHEIIHYKQDHLFQAFENFVENYRNTAIRYKTTEDEAEENILNFSKEHEKEADLMALELVKNAGYDISNAIGLMDITLYAYLPFDEIPFDESVMLTSGFNLANGVKATQLTPIRASEDIDDSKSTHPNTKNRKENLIQEIGASTGADFVISKDLFEYIKKRARIEATRYMVLDQEYARAIYNAFLLKQTYADQSDFADRIIAYSLYGASIYKNHYLYEKITPKMDNIEGEIQQVYYILNRMTEKDLNILAVAKTYEYVQAHPEDELMKTVHDDALWELTHFNELKPSQFNTVATSLEDSKSDIDTTTKVGKLKYKQNNVISTAWANNLLVPMNDTSFVAKFQEEADDLEDYVLTLPYDKATEEHISLADKRNPDSRYNKYKSKFENVTRESKPLPIDKIILANNYFRVNSKKGMRFEDSYAARMHLVSKLPEIAKLAKVDAELMDPKMMNSNDITEFNELSLIQDIMRETRANLSVGIINYTNDQGKSLAEKMGTRYVLTTSFEGEGNRQFSFNGTVLVIASLAGAAYNPALIGLAGPVLAPGPNDEMYLTIYDIQAGHIIRIKQDEVGVGTKDYLLRSQMYDFFARIKADANKL